MEQKTKRKTTQTKKEDVVEKDNDLAALKDEAIDNDLENSSELVMEEEILEEQEQPVDPEPVVEPEVKPSVKKPKVLSGKITDCTRLRVRKNPNLKAQVIDHFEVGDVFKVDEEGSTDTFYAVSKGAKTQGFCLKKFVKLI